MSFFQQREFHIRFGHDSITWSVQWLILANVAVYAVQLLVFVPLGIEMSPADTSVSKWVEYSSGSLVGGLIYVPITYMFLHSGLMHLFLNMIGLYFFGPDVERVLGTRNFLRFYLLCGALGVLANLIPFTLTGADFRVIGASGATLGVLVAFAVIDPERHIYLFPIPFPINARAVVILFIVMNLIALANPSNQTSIATHFGGMAVGFVYMKYYPALSKWVNDRRKRRPPSNADLEKLGEEIDNIFKFPDKDRR